MNDVLIINGVPIRWVPAPIVPPPSQKKAAVPGARRPQKTQFATDIVGLIPYISSLVTDQTVTIGSILLIETSGDVFLVKFEVLRLPDPILPVVGLYWPKQGADFWNLRDGYAQATHALARYKEAKFLERFNSGANTILLACSNAVNSGRMTQREYAYTARHLASAANNPERYR